MFRYMDPAYLMLILFSMVLGGLTQAYIKSTYPSGQKYEVALAQAVPMLPDACWTKTAPVPAA